MVLVLVKCADTLTVDQQHFQLVALVLSFKQLRPQPEALGTRVDGRTDSKALHLFGVDNDAVEQKGLAGTVFPRDGDNSYLFLNSREELLRFLRYRVDLWLC